MKPIETYCENVQLLAELIGEKKILKLTTETCDGNRCSDCLIHPNRIRLGKFIGSKAVEMTLKQQTKGEK